MYEDHFSRKIKWITMAEAVFSRLILLGLITMSAFVIYAAYDMHRITANGKSGTEFHDFEELIARNPDTVAWIKLDSTSIDHPVVQGKDNYTYLDVDFDGNDYAGGCIFLDASSSSDLSDEYSVIHGHHMAGGAMFGDLEKFLDQEFLDENNTGELLTPGDIYDLTIAGAGIFDAYDGEIYSAGPSRNIPLELIDKCSTKNMIHFSNQDKMIALSTCSGEMNNNRILVICIAHRRGTNEMQQGHDK